VSFYDFFAVFSAIAWILMQNFTNIFSHPISYIFSFRHFRVIDVTVMPPSEFVMLENIQAITRQIALFQLK